MKKFRLYSWNDAVKCCRALDHILSQKYFAKGCRKSMVTIVSISKSGWKISVDGTIQSGFYVKIGFENDDVLCPNEFGTSNGFTEDFSAKHISIDYPGL